VAPTTVVVRRSKHGSITSSGGTVCTRTCGTLVLRPRTRQACGKALLSTGNDANGCTITSQNILLPTNPHRCPCNSQRNANPPVYYRHGHYSGTHPATGVQFNNGIAYHSPLRHGKFANRMRLLWCGKRHKRGRESPVTSVTINPENVATDCFCHGQHYVPCRSTGLAYTASPASGVTYAWRDPAAPFGSRHALVVTNTTPAHRVCTA
jgi:hypothetical protein